ncbi:nucleoside monophosphate kinase [Candidatus Shapirobacteria bacterium]|nr:nucleoside monophosphate kinase [Candidatus Shapirobacteria bacterium]
MPLNLFIIGPSGCGKTTQAKLIAEKYKIDHLSMGQLLRDEITKGSGFGIEAKKYIDDGKLVPDDLVFDVLITKLKALNFDNFIIDGFPRVLNQGRIIEYYLRKNNMPITALIHLSVTFAEISARRAKMGDSFQDKTRTDNSPEDIASRQKFYDDNIEGIRDYFTRKSEFIDIDGNRPIEPIFADVIKAIDKLRK